MLETITVEGVTTAKPHTWRHGAAQNKNMEYMHGGNHVL